MEDKIKLPYSYHTFMYPFSYSDGDENNKSVNKEKNIKSILPAEWKKEAFYSKNKNFEQYKNQFINHYNTFCYLFPNARVNTLNIKESQNISEQYIYIPKKSSAGNDNLFQIILRDRKENPKAEENRTISLKIDQLKLSIFKELKIGVLTIESEYYETPSIWNKGKEINSQRDIVCLINDYGRRLFSPVYNVNNNFLPEKICLYLAGQEPIVTDFSRHEDLMDICADYQEPKLIKALLNNLKIKSILDDRMFVNFLIRDDSLGDSFKESTSKKKPIGDDELIYRLTFCDGDSVSCTDSLMREEILKDHVYTRWKNEGTIYTVTEYSFGCITGETTNIVEPVITPFLTLYIEMTKLALVQRAAISYLESEAVKLNLAVEKSNEKMVDDIRQLWKKYIIFQNELYMPEITYQEQGVELYGMLKKFLKLEELNNYLDEELNNLHDLAELIYSERKTKVDDNLAHALNLLTVASTVFALFSVAQDFLFGAQTINDWKEKTGFMNNIFLSRVPIEAGVTGIFIFGFIAMGIIIRRGMTTFDNYMKKTGEKRKKIWYWGYYVVVLLLVCAMCFLWSLLK